MPTGEDRKAEGGNGALPTHEGGAGRRAQTPLGNQITGIILGGVEKMGDGSMDLSHPITIEIYRVYRV